MHNRANTEVTNPLVSVVSLAYNQRDNVLELMGALREQDYANFEVLLIDNNS